MNLKQKKIYHKSEYYFGQNEKLFRDPLSISYPEQ